MPDDNNEWERWKIFLKEKFFLKKNFFWRKIEKFGFFIYEIALKWNEMKKIE